MNDERMALLRSLEEYGERHDRAEANRAKRYRNITRDTGEFLALLVCALPACRILEIGTSNGYSTIWLADAVAQTSGAVVTVECDSGRAEEALANFERAQLENVVELKRGNALKIVPLLHGVFDLVFLDAERSEYLSLWPALAPRIKPERGLLVVDNAVSHQHELAEFVALLEKTPRFITSLVPVGKGEYLALSTAHE